MSPVTTKLLRVLGRLAYAGALLVCCGVFAYLSFTLFVRSGATPTPSVVGMTEAEAEALLADRGLRLEAAEDGRFDPEIPAGAVVRQAPAPHTLVKRGSAVEVILSLGPERLSVPDLSDKAVPAAQVTLGAAGLLLGRTLRVQSERKPGTVVAQHPRPDETVPPSTPVDLFVASGGTGGTFVMPDLVYRDYETIRPFFESRGFRFGSVKYEIYEGAAEGMILRQFPLAGHPVSRSDSISVVVAAPPEARSADVVASADRG